MAIRPPGCHSPMIMARQPSAVGGCCACRDCRDDGRPAAFVVVGALPTKECRRCANDHNRSHGGRGFGFVMASSSSYIAMIMTWSPGPPGARLRGGLALRRLAQRRLAQRRLVGERDRELAE